MEHRHGFHSCISESYHPKTKTYKWHDFQPPNVRKRFYILA